jgi:alpha-beta hydrolase superfamily lysophospholipase
MPALESTIKAQDGTPLFVADWMPETADTSTGGIVLMHGLGEHCGRYAHVARFFNERGLSVRTFDHRGHGRSGGARGDVPDNEAILRDAKIVIDDFAHRLGGGKPMLFGHSMGGLFAARFATGRLSPVKALILSSPALGLPLSGFQQVLLKVLTSVAPGLGINNGLKTRYLSHDPAVEAAYVKDPLVHPKISARLLNSMRAAVDFAQSHAGELDVPVLLVFAGQDHLVDAGGSERFAARLAPGIGSVRRFDDFYHEIFNESGKAQVFDEVQRWLDRLPGAAARDKAPMDAPTT